IALRHATASTPAVPGFRPEAAIDGLTATGGWALATADRHDHPFVVEAAQPVGQGDETALPLVLHQHAGEGRPPRRLRLSPTTDALPVATAPGPVLARDIIDLAAKDPATRSQDDKDALARFYRRIAPELEPVRAALREAELRRADLVLDVPQSLITTTQAPDPVRILPRGNWLDETGEVV